MDKSEVGALSQTSDVQNAFEGGRGVVVALFGGGREVRPISLSLFKIKIIDCVLYA